MTTDTDNLVAELRDIAEGWALTNRGQRIVAAADRIEKQAAEIERLKTAPGNLEIVNGWLVERGAYELDYPAGAAYGAMPYSDAEPLIQLSIVPSYPDEEKWGVALADATTRAERAEAKFAEVRELVSTAEVYPIHAGGGNLVNRQRMVPAARLAAILDAPTENPKEKP